MFYLLSEDTDTAYGPYLTEADMDKADPRFWFTAITEDFAKRRGYVLKTAESLPLA